jgi:hypothetical protein
LNEFLRIADERPYSQPGKEVQGAETSAKYLAKAKKLLDVSSYRYNILEKRRCRIR